MRWKLILGIAGGIIVILLVVFYIVLSSYNFNYLKPQITRVAKEATGRELTLGGDIRLKISFTPALTVENVGFQNAPWGSRPEMVKVKQFEVQVALFPLLSKNLVLKRLILVEPDILVETNAAGKSNLEFEKEKKEAPAKPKEEAPTPSKGGPLGAFTVDELRVTNGRVIYRDGKSGKTTLIILENLALTSSGAGSPVKMKAKGAYERESFEAEGTLGPLAGLMSPGKPWPLNVTARAFGVTLTLEGSIKDVQAQKGIDLGFSVKGNDLASLGKVTGKPMPVKGPFEIAGRLSDPAAKTYKVSNLRVDLAGNDLGGTVEANVATSRPRISAVLSSKKLDVRSFMGEEAGKEPGKPAGGKTAETPAKAQTPREKVFPNDPLPFETLKQVDATVKFQGAKVLLPRMAMDNLNADMVLKDGNLSVKPLKATVGGGTLDAQLDLKPQGKAAILGAVIKVNQLNVGPMLKELQVTDMIEGRLDADIDVKGQGGSVAGLMGTLDGKSVVTMGQGKIDNRYIDLLGGDVSSGVFKLFGLSRQEAQYTAINCLVSGFNIKDGRAETTALVFDTGQVSVIGDGNIDLKTEKLNIGFNPIPKKGVGTSATGKVSVGLGELARNFKLSGTMANPSLGIDTTQAALTAGKMAAGFAALGPLGLAAPLITGSGPGPENLCPTATEAARKGVKMSALGKQEKKTGTGAAPAKKGAVKDIGDQLKSLFGK
jgi:uncharacterized protein involved in outer membrane biogenesis